MNLRNWHPLPVGQECPLLPGTLSYRARVPTLDPCFAMGATSVVCAQASANRPALDPLLCEGRANDRRG